MDARQQNTEEIAESRIEIRSSGFSVPDASPDKAATSSSLIPIAANATIFSCAASPVNISSVFASG